MSLCLRSGSIDQIVVTFDAAELIIIQLLGQIFLYAHRMKIVGSETEI